jgi:hypothetical protein
MNLVPIQSYTNIMKTYIALVAFFALTACADNGTKSTGNASETSADSAKSGADSTAAAVNAEEHAFAPPYTYIVPAGWTTEHFPFPVAFAPKIPLKGFEDIRFAPGWGNPENEEHWSYMFLWWAEGEPELNADLLRQYFGDYYSGLVGQNITERKIPQNKIVPTVAAIKKQPTASGDKETYSGSISMLNYMTQTPIELNCVVHVKACADQGHTAIFTEISPKPASHRIWKEFDTVVQNFSCSK